MNKISLLLTFDYEVYLGPDSGSAANCCIKPTNKILEILQRNNCRGIFFVDAMYLVRLNEVRGKNERAEKDWQELCTQIQRMVKEGHYVYHHLHPHWLDAVYKPETNTWNLADKGKFAFNNLNEPERLTCFDSSIQILYDIIRPVKPDYVIKGFRAGGLFIQPFAIFKKHFLKHKILYEFSVQAGAKCTGPDNNYWFDFTKTPEKKFFRFEDEVTEEQPSGAFTEFPLIMCHIKGWRKIANGLHYRLTSKSPYYKRYGDGLPSGNQVKFENADLKNSTFEHTESFSVESLSTFKAKYYFHEVKTKGHLHIISHPKLVSDYNLAVFDNFLSQVMSRYACTTEIESIIAANL